MEPYNAAERSHVKAAAKAAKRTELEVGEAVRGIMSVRQGRAWMLSILEACHIFQTTFTPNALTMAYYEGERNIGLRFLTDLMKFCPDEYLQMMREKDDRHLTAAASRTEPREPTGAPEPEPARAGPDRDAAEPAEREAEGGWNFPTQAERLAAERSVTAE